MAFRALSRRLPTAHPHRSITLTKVRYPQSRWTIPSRFFSAESVSHPSNLVQVYISRSTDPYLNLSIEHFLLQKSHPDSVILLLYTNRPCIVIGRNQNPWVEVNLGLVNQRGILKKLRAGTAAENEDGVRDAATKKGDATSAEAEDEDDVLLVRRRSGGGTVFHDAGNVNYSVICPPAAFDRNTHAEMVVRALRGLGQIPHGVRVNARHDIVLDVSPDSAPNGPRSTDSGMNAGGGAGTFKISGSAYKLTRARSLHHGTCLLASPHLPFLGLLLRSPAAPYIKARGVESVRSPVRNVGVSTTAFEDAVVAEFLAMYASHGGKPQQLGGAEILDTAAAAAAIPLVQAGVAELRSRDWVFAQTPQFAFSSHPTADDPRPRPDLPTDLPASFFPASPELDPTSVANGDGPGLRMTVRHGQITEVAAPGGRDLADALNGLHLHHVDDWRTRVGSENESVGRWLNRLFGVGG
ncbi:hypothetical protein F4825DRAFT_247773 [Nemania diffusa]|nr:hypothetical protein F4825DRAFT_247773 [Nemania diffusa]